MDPRELALVWYQVLSGLYLAVAQPLRGLADALGLSLLSALLFGLIGGAAPCQLTTNAAALAYVARRAGAPGAVALNAAAYILGKALMYMLLGLTVVLAGRELAAQGSIPVIVAARKALGPGMILLGLHLLGLMRLPFAFGQGLAGRLEGRSGSGAGGAFLLGVAFSFAFCPTLFLLFFGLTIPLALSSPLGIVYPGLFAVGTTLPLLGLAGPGRAPDGGGWGDEGLPDGGAAGRRLAPTGGRGDLPAGRGQRQPHLLVALMPGR